jgi:hypothetical protein
MSKYSSLFNNQVLSANEKAVEDGANSFVDSGGTSNVFQRSVQSITQSGTATITHATDTYGSRIIQVYEFIPGPTLSNTSLDFDLADEGSFIQEDATSGTDFLAGKVQLYNEAGYVFSSMDPSKNSGATLSENNLRINRSANGGIVWKGVRGLTAIVSNKNYYEYYVVSSTAPQDVMVGIVASMTNIIDNGYGGIETITYDSGGNTYYPSYSAPGASYTTGDVIGIAIDVPNKNVKFYKNNVFQFQRTWANATAMYPVVFICRETTSGYNGDVRMKVDPSIMIYSPPAEYTAGYSYSNGMVADTWDINKIDSDVTLSNNNKTATGTTSSAWTIGTSVGKSSGKYYAEFYINTVGSTMVGIAKSTYNYQVYEAETVGNKFYYQNGSVYPGGGSSPGSYTTGDVVGIALDLDNHTVKFSRNNTWGSNIAIDTATFHLGFCGAGGSSPVTTIRTDSAEMSYSAPYGYTSGWFSGENIFTTSQPYYVTTGSNNIDMTDISQIISCTITNSQPTNTNIKGLVSFDNRSTWSKHDSSSWTTHSGGLANLQTGNTIAEIEAGLSSLVKPEGATYLDFAFDLVTVSGSSTPTLDQITVNYTEEGSYKSRTEQYETEISSATQTNVTKLSSGSSNIKVNIIL